MLQNCRCYLTPVLSDPGALSPAYVPAAAPDPLVYAEWFDRADDRRRKIAVGAKRYLLLSDRLGKPPAWSDFLDPATGGLMTHAALRAETPRELHARTAKVRGQLTTLRRQTAQTSAAGFLPGEGLPAPTAISSPYHFRDVTKMAPPAADPAALVAAAVRATGGRYNLAPMTAVRVELARLGLTDRAAQDAAIQAARRQGLVSGSKIEGRHGTTAAEREAMLGAGDDAIGYLSLRAG